MPVQLFHYTQVCSCQLERTNRLHSAAALLPLLHPERISQRWKLWKNFVGSTFPYPQPIQYLQPTADTYFPHTTSNMHLVSIWLSAFDSYNIIKWTMILTQETIYETILSKNGCFSVIYLDWCIYVLIDWCIFWYLTTKVWLFYRQ